MVNSNSLPALGCVCVCVSVYMLGFVRFLWVGGLVCWLLVRACLYLFICVLALGICSGHLTVRLLASNVISGAVGFR